MRAVDNASLARWRLLDSAKVVVLIAGHAKRDATYVPVKDGASSRWHVSSCGRDFELLLTGTKFWDTRSGVGGGGAIDLVMHLEQLSFKSAVARLKGLGL